MSCPQLHHTHQPDHLLNTLLTTITDSIIPLTTTAVARGCKVFGAAILSKSTLTPIISSTNDELTSPLLHGEMATLFSFHRLQNSLPPEQRLNVKDCIFLSTHEPCSLCLSAITWSGFDNFYYMFTYKDTMDVFDIPHDIEILKEVFQTQHGQTENEQKDQGDTVLYNKKNKYWSSWSFKDLIDQSEAGKREDLATRLDQVRKQYNSLSETYQESKAAQVAGQIPLA